MRDLSNIAVNRRSDEMDNELAPRILTTQFGQYDFAPYDGINRSGLQPLCEKVLVMCDQAAPMTSGGIILSDETREKTGFAATSGVMVAVGDQAFAYDADRLVTWAGKRPEPGSRVIFQKYAGLEYSGRDGLLYRVMQDKQIAAVEIDVPDETIPVIAVAA
jgi:co-chaperonin GroES (HSP10)